MSGTITSKAHRPRPQTGGATVRLIAVGDICLARGVKQTIEKHGADFVFAEVKSVLQRGDLLFGNLECVISRPGRPLDPARVDMLAPASCAAALTRAGFTVLNIANNHIMDYGTVGLQETLASLEAKKILPLGAGADEGSARTPVLIEKKGLMIGFLGYADNSTGHSSRKDPSAGRGRPGIAAYNEKKILADVSRLREKADLIIVSLHADLEFSEYPAPGRVRFCRRLIDSGVRVVLQHHPHVPQGMERYRGGLIVYSLGNFVFPVAGNEYLTANSPYCDKSFILDVSLAQDRVADVNIIPVRITKDHRPEPLRGEEAACLIRYVSALSEPLHDAALRRTLGIKTSKSALFRLLNQVKADILELAFLRLARNLVSVFRTTEHRRWMKELLSAPFRRRFFMRSGRRWANRS